MCQFEDCWDKNNNCIYSDNSIVANIKPEIGKVRPVVVIHSHKRHRTALVIPFTTQEPQNETFYTVHIPQEIMPGILAKKECWALCDVLKTVSFDRLQLPFSGKKNLRESFKTTMLDGDKFAEICSTVHLLFTFICAGTRFSKD
jgi:uncharacterized protein YifN (PemK superfamily)